MMAIFNVGGVEIILILAIVLIPFVGEKLPELAKGLANWIREFKKAEKKVSEEMHHVVEPIPVVSRLLPPALADDNAPFRMASRRSMIEFVLTALPTEIKC